MNSPIIDPKPLDLSACDREPIHIPGSIQPHGYLIALREPDLTILQASENLCDPLRLSLQQVIGKPLGQFVDSDSVKRIAAAAGGSSDGGPFPLGEVTVRVDGVQNRYDGVIHRSGPALVLEMEPTIHSGPEPRAFHSLVRDFVSEVQRVGGVAELGQLAAREVRKMTGFDRVLVYEFDAEWNGTVIAEDRNDRLPSYLDLRFPASDIPKQARELYRLNRTRLIPDARYQPVPIRPTNNPLTGAPLDLSFSALRSVSPVHVQYMKNMGTMSSFSVSILRDGELWGLISCHHATPRAVSIDARTACDFLAQVFSVQLAAKVHRAEFEQRLAAQSVQSRLLGFMAEEEGFVQGLVNHPAQLLDFVGAQGAAVAFAGEIHLVGQTPAEADVRDIIDWLSEKVRREVFSTDSLAAIRPGAERYKDQASGLLGVSISKLHRSYILWFRPEVLQTIKWGGDPHKPVDLSPDGRLHPRRSFEMWKETVRFSSVPWTSVQADAATELRNAVVGIVLRKAEEMAEISDRLETTNKELEAFSYSVSHDLRAPFRHIVGFSQLLKENESDRLSEEGRRYVETIVDSARYAGKLVDSLLNFSQMGRVALAHVVVDLNEMLREVRAEIEAEAAHRHITWKLHPLPPALGDPVMLKLVVRNLLSNAAKYSRTRAEPVIEVGAQDGRIENIYFVRDNGVGFDMKYVDKLFGVFQRLHRMEEYEGTGIGLANVRRIVSRHGGRTWAEGAVDQGATFFFSLPKST